MSAKYFANLKATKIKKRIPPITKSCFALLSQSSVIVGSQDEVEYFL